MLDNKLNESVIILNNIKDNTVWSGSASSSFNVQLIDLIDCINNMINDVDKLEGALKILDEIKILDSDISKLNSNIVEITDDMDSETILDSNENNSRVNSLIYTKTNERNILRSKVIDILSSFGIIADIEVLQITDIEGANILYTYDTGCIYQFVTSTGQKYEAYVPFEVNPSKNVIVYDSGGMSGNPYPSGTDWAMFKEYFEKSGYDYIILKSDRQDTSSYYIDLCDRLNLAPDSRLFISHSGGFRSQYEEYYDLQMKEGSAPGVIAMMDGYINNNPKFINKIIEDETIIFGFHQNYMNEAGNDYITKGKNENLHLLILSDQSEYGRSHAGSRLSLIENGVIEYLTGDGELPNNYVIKYYNPSDPNADANGYSIVDYEHVKTLDDVYNFFGVER